jgi:DNA-binding NtrC family response regulator
MFRTLLEAGDYVVDTAASGEEALGLLDERIYDLVVTDLRMGQAGGLDVLRRAGDRSPATMVVIMTGYAALDTALQAIRGGAYDYITKPFTLDEIEVLLTNASERVRIRREKALLERELEDAYRLIAALQARPTEAPHATQAPRADADGGGRPASPQRGSSRRAEALAAAAWTPERAAERLATLLAQDALTREAYERLSALIPEEPTVA